MAATKKPEEPARNRRPPATTPKARENQLISLAVDLAEEQIRKGTASSQVITHFLKLGSTREKLEQIKIAKETELLTAKSEAFNSGKDVKVLYENALNAMRKYSGQDEEDEFVD